MHLFGDASGPHMAHFHARRENGCIELDWEVRNADELRWRVLRSEQGFAENAEPPGANGQVLVNESTDTYLADQGLDPDKHYCYTVFSQEPDGTWRKQVEVKLRPHDLLGWVHPQAHDIVDARGEPRADARRLRVQAAVATRRTHPAPGRPEYRYALPVISGP